MCFRLELSSAINLGMGVLVGITLVNAFIPVYKKALYCNQVVRLNTQTR